MTNTTIRMTIWERIIMSKKIWVTIACLAGCAIASAQFIADDPDWKETEVPPPPVFDLKRLVPFVISARSELKWGVDPATIVINRKDGVVRYVVVAQSPSGVVNAMYEGIRCNKAEYRLYARYNSSSGWVRTIDSANSDWKPLRTGVQTGHLTALAKQGMCDSSAPPTSVQDVVRKLRVGGQEVEP
jgi:CNP1-like family